MDNYDSIIIQEGLEEDVEKYLLTLPMDNSFLRGFGFTLAYKGKVAPKSKSKQDYELRMQKFIKECKKENIIPFAQLTVNFVEDGIKKLPCIHYNTEIPNYKSKLIKIEGMDSFLEDGLIIPEGHIHFVNYSGMIQTHLFNGVSLFDTIKKYIESRVEEGYKLVRFHSKNARDNYMNNDVEFGYSRELTKLGNSEIFFSYDCKDKKPMIFRWMDTLKKKYNCNEDESIIKSIIEDN